MFKNISENKELYVLTQEDIKGFTKTLNDIETYGWTEGEQDKIDQYEGILQLSSLSDTFFNYALQNPYVFKDRVITFETNLDTEAFLIIKDDRKSSNEIHGVYYNYEGYKRKDNGYNIFFLSNSLNKDNEIYSHFTVFYEGDKQKIVPGEGAVALRKYLYEKVYDGLKNAKEKENIFFSVMREYLNTLKTTEYDKEGYFEGMCKSLMMTESIWSGFGTKINDLFSFIKRTVTLICRNKEIAEGKGKDLLIESALYILNNFDSLDIKASGRYAEIELNISGEIKSVNIKDDNDVFDFIYEIKFNK